MPQSSGKPEGKQPQGHSCPFLCQAQLKRSGKHSWPNYSHKELDREEVLPQHTWALGSIPGEGNCQLYHAQHHSSLQLHWGQGYILRTQYFQTPPNLAGFWQFLQRKLLLCLPTQFAAACQLVWEPLTCPPALPCPDPRAAWPWSSLNGPKSPYKRRVHTYGKRGPMAHGITCRQLSIRQDLSVFPVCNPM